MTSKSFFQSLAIIHISMLTGVAIFLCVVLSGIVNIGPETPANPLSNPLIILAPVIAIGALAGQALIRKMRISQIDMQQSTSSKLMEYRSICIINWALLEGPALFAIVVKLVTNYTPVLFIAGIMLVLMARLRPSVENLFETIPFTMQEQHLIADPDANI